jgi:hypothetical protein
MINKILNDKIYISAVFICVFTYLLNFCTRTDQCALVFTLIAISVNVVTYFSNRSNAMKILACASIISFGLLSKLPYYVNGKIVHGLVFASFLSLIVSIYFSASIFQRLKSNSNLTVANSIALIGASVIDGIIMGIFFVLNNSFSYSKLGNIFYKELSYKMIYVLISSAVIFTVFKFLKINNNQIDISK